MKFINDKGKLFGLINIIDLVVIAAIILMGIGVGYRYLLRPSLEIEAEKDKKSYTATVLCSMVPPETKNTLKVGDRLYYDSTGYIETKVESISSKPASIESIAADGSLIINEHPVLEDLTVAICVPVDVDSPIIKMGGFYQVNVGKKIVLKTDRIEVNGIILSISD